MTKAEVDALMRGVAPVVRTYVARSNAELAARVDARLDALERALSDLTSLTRERQAPPVQSVEPPSTPGARHLLADALAARQITRGRIAA